jgi:hypothetical protein
MIAALAFESGVAAAGRDGRRVRRPVFVRRSTLPLSAACLVANGVRERLSRLLAAEVEVELIEPAIPGPAERRTLVRGATIARVRGRLCDGFVIVRPADARRLAALAFGEPERSEQSDLSEIERQTLARIVASLVTLCNTLCGTLGAATGETAERAACDLETYFEVRTAGAVRIAIGFGLTRDPAEDVVGPLTLDDLASVELEACVDVGAGVLGVPAFSRIAVGSTIALATPLGSPGIFRVGDVPFARVTCGHAGGRNAAVFDGPEGGA